MPEQTTTRLTLSATSSTLLSPITVLNSPLVKSESGDEAWFYKAKLATARFYMTRILPESSSLLTVITAGAKPLMALEAEAF